MESKNTGLQNKRSKGDAQDAMRKVPKKKTMCQLQRKDLF